MLKMHLLKIKNILKYILFLFANKYVLSTSGPETVQSFRPGLGVRYDERHSADNINGPNKSLRLF